MKKQNRLLATIIATASLFTACTKIDSVTIDTTNNGSYKTFIKDNVTYVQNFVADTIQGYDPTTGQPIGETKKRVFYSLERGEAVTDTSLATWDLAFNGSKIWTNSGTSGNKKGGAYNSPSLFAAVTNAVDSIIKVDNGSIRAITGYDAAPNTASNNGWYTLTPPPPAASVIVPVPGRTIIVRTASGKYAKMEIMSYYKGGVTPTVADAKIERYYNFRFMYQANGSSTF